jgi:endonuclease YncB( thermonuclease family)
MGMDAPEIGQPFAYKAKDELAKLILNKEISFTFRTGDHFNRFIGIVSLGSSETKDKKAIPDIGLWMIENGLAWEHRSHKSYREVYRNAQSQARKDKLGLWSEGTAQRPFNYREEKNEARLKANDPSP